MLGAAALLSACEKTAEPQSAVSVEAQGKTGEALEQRGFANWPSGLVLPLKVRWSEGEDAQGNPELTGSFTTSLQSFVNSVHPAMLNAGWQSGIVAEQDDGFIMQYFKDDAEVVYVLTTVDCETKAKVTLYTASTS